MKPKKIAKKWTKKEEDYLLEAYKIKPISEIAKEMDRGEAGVYSKLRFLTDGDMSKRFGGKSSLPWTEEDINFLLNNLQMSTAKLANKLGRSRSSVYNKRNNLKSKPKPKKKEKQVKAPSEFEIEREKAETKAYKRLINEPIIARLRLSDIKIETGQVYTVSSNNSRKKVKNYFKGEVIQVTQRHITLKDKNGRRETFLKADILLKEYEFEEVG